MSETFRTLPSGLHVTGSGVPATPAGVGRSIHVAEKRIAHAAIIQLHAAGSPGPVTIIGAPPAGKGISVLAWNVYYDVTTTGYTTNDDLELVDTAGTPNVIGEATDCLAGTVDRITGGTVSGICELNDPVQVRVKTGAAGAGNAANYIIVRVFYSIMP